MGKKSLLKSTAKKKKSGKKSGIEKTTGAVETAPRKKSAKKKAVARKKTAAKKAVPRKLTVKELVFEKFDTWKPEKPFTVTPDENYLKNFSAPPFVSESNKEDEERIKKLLSLGFDMKAINAAGEKAAAEKAAAEKAAAEKAAAEKAAAEKAAAEKAAAEQAAAEEAESKKSSIAGMALEAFIPMQKTILIMITGVVLIFIPILIASLLNSSRYYLEARHGAVKIFQGAFAPLGKELLVVMPGIQPPEQIKDTYSKEEAFIIAFNYFVERSDALLHIVDMLDFNEVRAALNKAYEYAVTKEQREMVYAKLTAVNLKDLTIKGDIAAGLGTVEGVKKAIGYLDEASDLDIEKPEIVKIEDKIEALKALEKELKNKPDTQTLKPVEAVVKDAEPSKKH